MFGRRAVFLLLLATIILEGVSAKKKPKPSKKKKPCKYNGKKYKPGEVIEALEDNCVVFRCASKGKKTELVAIDGCTCSRDVTPEPTPDPTDDGSGGSGGSGGSDCDYSGLGSGHTMNLPPKTSCGKFNKNSITTSERNIILQTHNNLRAKVANGLESQGSPGPQPGATNMRELTWNAQLAEVAQAWAEQCTQGHDSYDNRKICEPKYTVGQNIYFAWGHSPTQQLKESVEAWYGEVKDMPKSTVNSFTSAGAPGVIGHYTQVVWAVTYEVGCGAIHYANNGYPESKIYVCNYGPAGNFLKQPVYESGAAASNCPAGTSASTAYPGLCA